MASSESKLEDEELGIDEGRKGMEPNDEGVLELEDCSKDEKSSLNGLFHWQIEDYEVFSSMCKFLQATTLDEEQLRKACKVMNGTFDFTKSKISNVECTYTCQVKSMYREGKRKFKNECMGEKTKNDKISNVGENYKTNYNTPNFLVRPWALSPTSFCNVRQSPFKCFVREKNGVHPLENHIVRGYNQCVR